MYAYMFKCAISVSKVGMDGSENRAGAPLYWRENECDVCFAVRFLCVLYILWVSSQRVEIAHISYTLFTIKLILKL